MQISRLSWTGAGCASGLAVERRARGSRRQRRPLCVAEVGEDSALLNGSSSNGVSGGGSSPFGGSSSSNGTAATATAAAAASSSMSVAATVCDPCSRPSTRAKGWPQKSELYILRSDGYSCTRETVQPSGNLQFACPSSQQQLLVWKTRPKRVMVLKKLGDELMEEYIDVLRYLGEDLEMRVVVEPHDYQELEGLCMSWVDTFSPAEDLQELHSFVDFIVCLGGDGLILHAAALFGAALPPVISFKLGSLGFLTAHNFEDYRRHLHNVVHGCQELTNCNPVNSEDGEPLRGVHITLRMRLQCEIWRDGAPLPGALYEVLNEVVLSRGANPYLSKIEVFEQNQLITKVQADGVMLATPTGSTAYNVAAGGSMVHPSVPAILFTPICPHSLNFRPIILPDYVELELRIAPDARCAALVCFDGRDTRELQQGDSVRVRMSPNPVPTINNADQTTDWFSSIQRCFQWSERVEQVPMDALSLSKLQASSSSSSMNSLASLGGSGMGGGGSSMVSSSTE